MRAVALMTPWLLAGCYLAHERDVGGGRELLAHSARRFPGGAGGNLGAVAEDDVVHPEQGEVVRDARAYRAGAGNNDSSHASSSRRSSSVGPRSGARTSSCTGTPRRPSTRFSAAWRGKRSIASRTSARRGSTETTS